jgi:hypothetical protein
MTDLTHTGFWMDQALPEMFWSCLASDQELGLGIGTALKTLGQKARLKLFVELLWSLG